MGKSNRSVPWWVLMLLVLASPLILVVVMLAVAARLVAGALIHVAVWLWWWPRGRDVLFVYSDSPVWHDYIEINILPNIRQRAILLNWSQRSKRSSGLAWAVFRHFGGKTEFCPLAVVFRPFGQVFRFWQPFRDWKHGRGSLLEQTQAEFFQAIGIQSPKRNSG